MEDFRKKLAQYKEELGLSDAEFERRGNLSPGYYRDLMKREHVSNPSLPKIAAVCKAVGKRPDQIFPELQRFYPPEAIELLNELDAVKEKKLLIQKKMAALGVDKTSDE